MIGKITSKQSMIMYSILLYPIMLWAVPTIAAQEAKQAAWLSPIPVFFILLFFIKQINYLSVKNPYLSLMQCFEKATNKIIVKVYAFILLLYLLFDLSTYLRLSSEQLNSSIYPNVNIDVFLISMLVIVNVVLHSNITILARIGEMLLFFLFGILIILIVLLLPNISIANITPISYLDIIPIIKCVPFYISVLPFYYICVLIFNDQIVNKTFLYNYCKNILFSLLILQMLLLICSIGSFGYYFSQNTPYSYLTFMKQLNIVSIDTEFESIIIIFWVISEFVVLGILSFSCLKLFQYIFNIKNIKSYINVFIIFIYILSKLSVQSIDTLALSYYTYISQIGIVIGFIIPLIMVLIYRIRFRKKKSNI